MLFRAPSLEIFNVGSEESISIADLARRVVTTLDPQIDVKVAKRALEGNVLLQYVPSTAKGQAYAESATDGRHGRVDSPNGRMERLQIKVERKPLRKMPSLPGDGFKP